VEFGVRGLPNWRAVRHSSPALPRKSDVNADTRSNLSAASLGMLRLPRPMLTSFTDDCRNPGPYRRNGS